MTRNSEKVNENRLCGVPLWCPLCGVPLWCPLVVSPVVSPCGVPLWCPLVVSPCGVSLWCPLVVSPVVSPCGVPLWCPLWCPLVVSPCGVPCVVSPCGVPCGVPLWYLLSKSHETSWSPRDLKWDFNPKKPFHLKSRAVVTALLKTSSSSLPKCI